MKTPPSEQVDEMPAAKFFAYGAELMKQNPPHVADWSQIARFKRMGMTPGKSFDFNKADPTVKRALERASLDGLALMKEKAPTLARIVDGWQMSTDTIGANGDYYPERAIVAKLGFGGNQPEDAIYPLNLIDKGGNPLSGENNYVIHFAKGETPPAGAFWSVTLYDGTGCQAANTLIRFAIGDRDPLKYNADGSLDLYIQSANPGLERQANGPPSPASGAESHTMRLYAPKAEALAGRWSPPWVTKAK